MALWEIVKEMVQPMRHRCALSVAQVAAVLGRDAGTVYKWCEDPETSRRELPASAVPRLTLALEDDLLIERLCSDCGGVFVRLEAEEADVDALNRVVQGFAGLAQAWADATSAGGDAGPHVTLLEARRLSAAGEDAVRAVLALVGSANAEAETWAARHRPGARAGTLREA